MLIVQVVDNVAMALVFTILFLLVLLSGPLSAWLDRSRDMNDRDRRTTWPGARA